MIWAEKQGKVVFPKIDKDDKEIDGSACGRKRGGS